MEEESLYSEGGKMKFNRKILVHGVAVSGFLSGLLVGVLEGFSIEGISVLIWIFLLHIKPAALCLWQGKE